MITNKRLNLIGLVGISLFGVAGCGDDEPVLTAEGDARLSLLLKEVVKKKPKQDTPPDNGEDNGGGSNGGNTTEPDKVDPVVLQKSIDDGKAIYPATCGACHQVSGAGIPTVYPPLAKSNWVNSLSNEEIIKLSLFGLQGEIQVNGQPFTGVMPPQGVALDDKKIADLINFVKNSWDNSGGYVSPEEVKAVRDANPGQTMLKQEDFKTLKQ